MAPSVGGVDDKPAAPLRTNPHLAIVELSGTGKERAAVRWAIGLALFAAVAAVFQSARHGAFLLWDDNINIVANPQLRELSWENVRWLFTDVGYMRRYVPLAWLGWSIDHQL